MNARRRGEALHFPGTRPRAILALSASIAIACAPAADRNTVRIGAPAPPYAATTLAGDSVSLATLRGRVVLLNIWATWCTPCRDEIPVLQALHQQHADDGLEILGVSIDARGEERRISSFAAGIGMTYPIWHDPDEHVSTLYRAIGVPSTYLIDREGVLRWQRIGPIAEGDTAFLRVLSEALATSPGEPAVSSAR